MMGVWGSGGEVGVSSVSSARLVFRKRKADPECPYSLFSSSYFHLPGHEKRGGGGISR